MLLTTMITMTNITIAIRLDRCHVHYNYISSFIYDIIYPAFNTISFPQPLMLKPYVVRSSIGSINSIECCAVQDQQNFNHNLHIVHPGDIVLRVNDIDIFGVYNFQDSIDKVLDPNVIRVIRFFRPAALTQNLSPSIAEIKLFMVEKNAIAKFNFNVNSAINGYNYDLISHDQNLIQYPAVAKMLKRQRVQWEVLPGQETKFVAMNGFESYSSGTNGKWIPYGKLRRGIYGDRDKYISVGDAPFAHVATDSSISRRFYLGRYNSDEVALAELEKERELKIVNNVLKLDVQHLITQPVPIVPAPSLQPSLNSQQFTANPPTLNSQQSLFSQSSSSSFYIPNQPFTFEG